MTLSAMRRWRNCEMITVNKKDQGKFNKTDTDPLLALAGTLKSDDISGPDTISLPEIRVVKGAHENHPDPLIASLGTLESDVTDIGERHGEYIRNALLAELWGDEDK